MNAQFVKPILSQVVSATTTMMAAGLITKAVERAFPSVSESLPVNASKKEQFIKAATVIGIAVAIGFVSTAAGGVAASTLNKAWDNRFPPTTV